MGTGSVYSQDTSWGWGVRQENLTLAPARVHCAPSSHSSHGLWVTLSPKFMSLLFFYSTCSYTILVEIFWSLGHSYLLQPGVGGRIQVQKGTNTIHSKNANAQRTIYQVAGFHNSLKSWHTQL